MPQPYDSTNDYEERNAIVMFREMIDFSDDADDKKKKIVMGSLYGKVSSEDFVAFCTGFIDGVEYEANKYGVMPNSIILSNASDLLDNTIASYSQKSAIIEICRDTIPEAINLHTPILSRELKGARSYYEITKPFLLSLYDDAFLAGAHETFHMYDGIINPQGIKESISIRNALTPEDRKGGKTSYDLIPSETRAREEVRAVMIERGLVYTAPVCPLDVTTEDREWAAPYLRERAERAFAINAALHPQEKPLSQEKFDPLLIPTSTVSPAELQKQLVVSSHTNRITITIH